MNLLIFLHSLSAGGAERVTATLANYWAAKGWTVTVLSITGSDGDFYRLHPAVRRIALNMAGYSRTPAQAVTNNLRRIRALHRVLKRERPAIAVAMMPTANSTLAIAGRLAGVPTVGSERIHPPAFPLGKIWESVRRRAYPLLSGLVAQTEDSAAWLRVHAPAQRIRVIPNPFKYPLVAHEPRVSPEEVLTSLPSRRVLLAVGRLEEQKGFDRLLTAFARACEQQADWALVILGQGSSRGALIQRADELGIEGRLVLPGAVGNVGEWFEAADLYALTSRFEGFPNTLLEALAYGVPAVAVDCETGPREIVRHEVDGLLVPQDNPKALAAALDRMMGDAALRARLAERTVEARERFAVERIAAQWEALFREITTTNGSSEGRESRDQVP